MVATAKDNDSRDQDWNKLAKKVSAFVAMSRLTLAISQAIREIDPDRPADSPLLSFVNTTRASS